MRILTYLTILIISIFLFTGCAKLDITKQDMYPNVYKKHPKSILVLPARNLTTAANASEHYSYTLTKSLTEAGYYVLPIHLVDKFFKSENLSDPNIIHNIPVSKLKKIFNVDAILYIDIFNWDTNYYVILSSVSVGFSFSLVDTKTEQEIWNVTSLGQSSSEGGGIVEALILSAINTSIDYTTLANFSNQITMKHLPYGFLHKEFKKDKNQKISFLKHRDKLMNYMYQPTIKNNKLYIDRQMMENTWNVKDKSLTPLPGTGFGVINNYAFTRHSKFDDYYYISRNNIKNHSFFHYEDNKPFILVSNSKGIEKVFLKVDKDRNIIYNKNIQEDSDDRYTKPFVEYYFYIDKIVPVKTIK
jgi:hypothetical protein